MNEGQFILWVAINITGTEIGSRTPLFKSVNKRTLSALAGAGLAVVSALTGWVAGWGVAAFWAWISTMSAQVAVDKVVDPIFAEFAPKKTPVESK